MSNSSFTYKNLEFTKIEKCDTVPGYYIDEDTYYACTGTPYKLTKHKSGEYSLTNMSVTSITGYGFTVADAFQDFKSKISTRINHLQSIQASI